MTRVVFRTSANPVGGVSGGELTGEFVLARPTTDGRYTCVVVDTDGGRVSVEVNAFCNDVMVLIGQHNDAAKPLDLSRI